MNDEEFERLGTGAVPARESDAGKFFCDLSLLEKRSDHTYFSRLKAKNGLVADVFNFVDASQSFQDESMQ